MTRTLTVLTNGLMDALMPRVGGAPNNLRRGGWISVGPISERTIRMTGGYWVARLKRAMTTESDSE